VKAGSDVAVDTVEAMADVRAFLLHEGRLPDDVVLVRFGGRFGADGEFTVVEVVLARGKGME
jgi:hypothetical protein